MRQVGDGLESWTSYDGVGNVTATRDTSGGTATRTYDAHGNPSTVKDAQGTTSYAYDLADNVVSRTDSRGGVTTWTYDPMSRPTSMTVGGQRTTYGYDLDGRLVKTTDPEGRSTSLTLDDAGNALKTEYRGQGYEPVDVQQTFDDRGRRRSLDGVPATYDARGNLVAAAGFTYDYSKPGSVVETYPGGKEVTYGLDEAGNLMSVRAGTEGAPGYVAAAYVRDGERRATGLALSNGVLQTRAFDANGNLLDQTVRFGGSVLAHDAYTWDARGNRTSQRSSALGQTAGARLRLRGERPPGRRTHHREDGHGGGEARGRAALCTQQPDRPGRRRPDRAGGRDAGGGGPRRPAVARGSDRPASGRPALRRGGEPHVRRRASVDARPGRPDRDRLLRHDLDLRPQRSGDRPQRWQQACRDLHVRRRGPAAVRQHRREDRHLRVRRRRQPHQPLRRRSGDHVHLEPVRRPAAARAGDDRRRHHVLRARRGTDRRADGGRRPVLPPRPDRQHQRRDGRDGRTGGVLPLLRLRRGGRDRSPRRRRRPAVPRPAAGPASAGSTTCGPGSTTRTPGGSPSASPPSRRRAWRWSRRTPSSATSRPSTPTRPDARSLPRPSSPARARRRPTTSTTPGWGSRSHRPSSPRSSSTRARRSP